MLSVKCKFSTRRSELLNCIPSITNHSAIIQMSVHHRGRVHHLVQVIARCRSLVLEGFIYPFIVLGKRVSNAINLPLKLYLVHASVQLRYYYAVSTISTRTTNYAQIPGITAAITRNPMNQMQKSRLQWLCVAMSNLPIRIG